MGRFTRENLFKKFTQEMNDIFNSEEFVQSVDGRDQRAILNDLFSLERKFRRILQSTKEGRMVYADFLRYITTTRGNILSGRIYFRERQDVFTKKVAPVMKTKQAYRLYRLRINYRFMKWVVERYDGPTSEELKSVYEEVVALRKTICEQNLPLAINRAKIFWSKAPSVTLEYMDLIQGAAEGLMTAIDKFVPPYRTVFRSVAISRMLLNMMQDSNDTLVRLPSREKRVLYRARKAVLSKKIQSDDQVLDFVKESFGHVTMNGLNQIILASNQSYDIDKREDSIEDEAVTVESLVEEKQVMDKFWTAVRSLSLIDQKILFLKYGFSDPINSQGVGDDD